MLNQYNTGTPNKIINSRDTWDSIYAEAVSIYWNDLNLHELQDDRELTELLLIDALKVRNAKYIKESDGQSFVGIFNPIVPDELILKVKFVKEKAQKYNETFSFPHINCWTDWKTKIEVVLPPTIKGMLDRENYTDLESVLSNYMSLGCYFPFDSTIKKENPELLKYEIKNNEKFFESLASDALEIFDRGLDSEKISKLVRCYFQENDIVRSDSNTQGFEMNGDRGGVIGLHDDSAWERFIPRLISYNWLHTIKGNLFRLIDAIKTEGNDNHSEIKDIFNLYEKGDITKREVVSDLSQLNGFRDYLMFDNVDSSKRATNFNDTLEEVFRKFCYEKDKNVEINFKFAESLPSIESKNEYVSTLTVSIPKSPDLKTSQPMALADLMAIRANQPFTSS